MPENVLEMPWTHRPTVVGSLELQELIVSVIAKFLRPGYEGAKALSVHREAGIKGEHSSKQEWGLGRLGRDQFKT